MKTFLGIGLGPIQTGIFVSGASKGNFDRIVVAEVDDTIREAIRAAGGTITINIAAPDRVYTEVCKNIEVYSPAKPEELEKLIAAAAEASEIATALPSVKFSDPRRNGSATVSAATLTRCASSIRRQTTTMPRKNWRRRSANRSLRPII